MAFMACYRAVLPLSNKRKNKTPTNKIQNKAVYIKGKVIQVTGREGP
jgi:hypothetical protein